MIYADFYQPAPQPPPPPPPPPGSMVLAGPKSVPLISLPAAWFRTPLDSAIRKLVRPSVAHTRRKMLTIKMAMPREIFEEFLSPLNEEDGSGLARTEDGRLIPANVDKKSAVNRFACIINRGSLSDRLFHLNTLDPPLEPEPVSEIGEDGVFEVQAIWGSRPVKGKGKGRRRFEYAHRSNYHSTYCHDLQALGRPLPLHAFLAREPAPHDCPHDCFPPLQASRPSVRT